MRNNSIAIVLQLREKYYYVQ